MTGIGNLPVHRGKPEEAGHAEIVKTHRGRTSVTFAAPTRRGRVAFDDCFYFDDHTAAIRSLPAAAETGRTP